MTPAPLRLASLALPILLACGADPVSDAHGGAATTTSTLATSTAQSSSISGSSGAGTTSGMGGATGMGGAGGAGGSSAAGFSMLSLNLHCLKLEGTAFATNAARFAAIANLAAARDVAVLAVQEACRKPGEDAMAELRGALEQATSAPWSSTWSLAHVAWEGTPDQADEGVGLLVRGALSNEETTTHVVQGALRRVAVSANLPASLHGARVTSVHFEVFEEPARAAQAREMAVKALVDTDPGFLAILAGDFNDVEGSATVGAFPAMGFLDATAGLDPTGIDHVMIHRAAPLRKAASERVFLGGEAVSDHPGILVRFAPAAGDAVAPTRVRALADVGANHYLTIRGDAPPLSWSVGFPMRLRAPEEHAFVSTEITGAFSFKTLIDDTQWQSGSDVVGAAGEESVVSPSF